MKLQLGLLHQDGTFATQDDCLRILGQFAGCPTKRTGEIVNGPLAIAYRGDCIAIEEEYETQPLWNGPHILTFDGRLDNRDALATRLGITAYRTTPDTLLVASAYEQFGDCIFAELIGEFALALWCSKTRSLRLVRSMCGSRPLYYVVEKDRLVWSSDFAHLVRISTSDLKINDAYLLEYIVSQPHYRHTPLCHVQTVPPGSAVHFINGSVQPPLQFWRPKEVPPIRFHSDAEYESRLRDLLFEAVRVKLRSKQPVVSELSGGLDSSTLVLAADQINRSTSHSFKTLQTVSCVYEESETCDERYFIRCVEQERGGSTLNISEESQQITLGLRNIEFSGLPSPFDCFPGRFRSYAALLRQHGGSVLLSGEGGDHLFWSVRDGTPVIADYIQNRNLSKAHQACVTWSRATAVPYLRLLSKSARLAFGSQYQPASAPACLGTDCQKRFASEVWDAGVIAHTDGIPSFRAHVRQIEALRCQLAAGYVNHYHDVYVSYPYTYRPLVEFCLGVPASQSLRNGEARSLMRRALRNLLPLKILNRKSKVSLNESFARALSREWFDIGDLHQWEVCRRGLVDRQRLHEELRLTRLGVLSDRFNLVRAFSLERWLRSLHHVSRCQSATRLQAGRLVI